MNGTLTKLAAVALLCAFGCAATPDGFEAIESRAEEGVDQVYLRYPSGELQVTGWLFTDPGDPEPRPLLVFNHGGVNGVSGGTRQLCRQLVGQGFTVFAPSYRGEDDSEGEIEVAVGEVDDVLAAIHALEGHALVDADRILLAGTSHGALVSMKAACRPELCGRLRGVVAGYGVMDIYAWYQYLLDNDFDTRDPLSLRIYGEGPDDRPEAFAQRHLPNFLDQLCAAPVLVIQGARDRIVPWAQADSLRRELLALGRDQDTVRIYPTGGHGFLFWDDAGLHGPPELADAEEARQRMFEFLRKQAGIGGS